MTSTVRKISEPARALRGRRAGFTLLEIVIVLLISALILGGAVGVMTFSSDEYALKKASREVEGMAKRARATAILKQVPYALEFSPGMVRLMPWSEAIGERTDEIEDDPFDREEEEAANKGPVRWELSLDNGMGSQLRRWDSDEWIKMSDGERQLWRFDPDGLCEPISVELWLPDGRIAMEFNPLTAAINEVQYLTK